MERFTTQENMDMLFGILTSPDYRYLTGLFFFSVIYSISIIDSAMSNSFTKKKFFLSLNLKINKATK